MTQEEFQEIMCTISELVRKHELPMFFCVVNNEESMHLGSNMPHEETMRCLETLLFQTHMANEKRITHRLQ